MTEVDIRLLTTWPEMHEAVALQRSYWGEDPEAVVPGHMLLTLSQHGGHVLAAVERAGGRLVAILIGLPGIASDATAVERPYLVSKRMVVHADWRQRGLALRLKLVQRERALAQGVNMVRWTFDPVLAPNAWLNFHRLGTQASRLRENFFGAEGPGGMASAGSPDRLLVEWSLDSERVCALAAGKECNRDLVSLVKAGARLINKTKSNARGLSLPGSLAEIPDAPELLLELPLDFPMLVQLDRGLAQEWSIHMRAALTALFASGHVLHDCVRGMLDGQERLCYLSRRAEGEMRA